MMCGLNKVILVLFMFGVASCNKVIEPGDPDSASGVSLHTELGGSAEGYLRACEPREFAFPQDHGAHAGYRNEWWYVTGNLTSAKKTRFGFHATFFRVANKPADAAIAGLADARVTSAWATSEFYMAHFAIVREGAERVSAHERFARSANGLAGASVNESGNVVRVWLDDWQLLANEEDGELVWQLKIRDGKDALDLVLKPGKPRVLQGINGYSQKSADPCNSSYYYSFTRMQATGSVVTDDQSSEVTGSAWLDREWSSSALGSDQVGWDWFALQLDDGRDIMFYQLRKNNGVADPHSHAVEIDKDGSKTEIPLQQIELEIDRWWQSRSGSRYPVSGTIHRKDTGEAITFRPLIDDQELDLTVRYWEGAIKLTDADGEEVGRGYLELTGY